MAKLSELVRTRRHESSSPEAKLLKLIDALESRGDHDRARGIERSAMTVLFKYRRDSRLVQDLLLMRFLTCLRESASELGNSSIAEAFAQVDYPKSRILLKRKGTLH